jgi:hypothetical protein
MNELNPGNAFGELLLDLIEAQYGESNIDAGIEAIMSTTGLPEDEIVAIISGDVIVEDESLLSSIIDAFPDADDADLEVIVNVATAVDEQDRADLIEEIEADEADMEMEEMPMEEDEEMAPMGYYDQTAQFAQHNASRINQLENQLAEFQYSTVLSNELKDLDAYASRYVDSEMLPPSYKTMLIGNFQDDSERLAQFSQTAAQNGVDIETMLFATRYAMSMLTDASTFIEFKDYSATEEDVAIANFQANISNIAQEDLYAIFGDAYDQK